MSISPVTFTVHQTPILATYTSNVKHKVGETAATAVQIGDLEQQGTVIKVDAKGTTQGTQTFNFSVAQGDNLYLSRDLASVFDVATTQIQLLDSQGNIVADNFGTDAQKTAFKSFIGSGLTPSAGNYSVNVIPLTGQGAPQISISSFQQQGTSLSVNSSINTTQPADYYDFTVSNSNNIKLAFDAGGQDSQIHVQLYAPVDSIDPLTGKTVTTTGQLLADNQGTLSLQQNFQQLTSGQGLSQTAPGNYILKVSYGDKATPTDAGLKYNFQLYSGSTYAVVDQTNATAPTASSITAAQSVTRADRTAISAQTAYHRLNETAQSGVSIGYLQQNKSSLLVSSLLTPVDSTDYYNFVLQKGSNNIKLSVANLTNKSSPNAVHLQLYDNSGVKLLADNQGSPALKEAFAQLTSSSGLTAKSGNYVVKATYGQGAAKSEKLAYNIQLYSGTSYSALYKTTAPAQTYQNAVLNGNIANGYSSSSAAAAYINGQANGSAPNILDTLQTLV